MLYLHVYISDKKPWPDEAGGCTTEESWQERCGRNRCCCIRLMTTICQTYVIILKDYLTKTSDCLQRSRYKVISFYRLHLILGFSVAALFLEAVIFNLKNCKYSFERITKIIGICSGHVIYTESKICQYSFHAH